MRVSAWLLLLLVACASPRTERPELAAAPTSVEGSPRTERLDPAATPAPSEGPPAPAAAQITYVANAGVLLTAGDTAVLIDGLHRPYKPEYAVLDPDRRRAAEHAEGPFAAVRLVLVSHVHRDHFDAEAVRDHLAHNPEARLVGAPQIVDAVAAVLRDPAQRRRLEVVPYTPGARHVRRFGDISIELLGLPHVREKFRDVHNVGHIIELGGRRFLHVGDAELRDSALAGLALPARGLDVAFLPYWYFLSPEGVADVARLIGARTYYAVHIPPDDPNTLAELARSAPGVIPLVEPLARAPLP